MIKGQIGGIFPVPLYRATLNRKFTGQELRFVEKMKEKCTPNIGNVSTINTHILNAPSFTTLKNEVTFFLKDYLTQVTAAPKSISPYVTQSWLNYTEKNNYHHKHNHPNSYISGVIYINADKAHDTFTFEHNKYEQIKLPVTKRNIFNSDTLSFPVGSGEVMIFPSSLVHSVEKKKGNNTRVSLSFNVFLKGSLGEESRLTELKI